jgi:hypothetical protein
VPYSTSVAVTGLKVGKTTITGSANGRVTTVELEVVAAPGISGFDSYNVAVGNTYDAYLYLSALVPAGTPLSFTSSNPAVSPAPPPVTLSDSRTYVKFPLTGLSSGTALLTVNLGGTMRTAVIYVGGASQYPSYFSYLSTSSNTLQIGSSAYSTVSLSVPSPADMPVTLAASASGVVVLPQASTFIAAGSTQVSFPIVAVGAGSVDITVTAGGVQQSTTINVVSTPTFTLNMNASAGAGTIVLATLQSDCVLPANVSFVLASTGAAASVSQGSITLGPGPTSSSNSFVVNALAAGMTTITATTGGSTVISAPLTVTP